MTCSNGTGSGVVVPGTGVHVNNMLGEEDLNPGGFHRIPPGRRVSSMMSPTLALRDGAWVATPFPNQDSSMLVPLASADCLVIRERHAPAAPAGSSCQFVKLDD